MKKTIRHSSFVIAALSVVSCQLSVAQTNSVPPNSGSFFNSVGNYFTSFNTNLEATFGQTRGKLWTGVVSLQGGNTPLANVVGLSYDVYKPSNSAISISLESETLNSGVAGTVVSQEIGPGLNFIIHDTELTAFAHGGYELSAGSRGSRVEAGIGLRLCKALTAHTYAGTELSIVLPRNEQRIGAFAGFTF